MGIHCDDDTYKTRHSGCSYPTWCERQGTKRVGRDQVSLSRRLNGKRKREHNDWQIQLSRLWRSW
jgi:hypothetical protein